MPEPVEPSDDSALPQRIAAGDRAAEARFVASWRRGVTALVRRHCRPQEPAIEDMVQDVLMIVIGKLREGALRDPAALPGYLRSTVVLTVQAEYRKRARRGEDEATDGSTEAAVSARDDGEPGPVLSLQRHQLARHVRGLLASLEQPRDREILRRFYLQEEEREQVCAALGIDESHFRRVLFRARERLGELARRAGMEATA